MAVSDSQAGLTYADFAEFLESCCPEFAALDHVAAAVSGGPDSLALAALLQEAAQVNAGRPELHVITIDHGLRDESADEARKVKRLVNSWPSTRHVTLTWTGDKPDTGLQEAARRARYQLMGDYCRQQAITHVFTAHHADDQAETVLFRLARGSGLDGLAGMPYRQVISDDINLFRPLLDIEKRHLIATCNVRGLAYRHDPTNMDTRFTRPRLRQAYDVLAGEGLTGRRLQRTAHRLGRARNALEHYTQTAIDSCVDKHDNSWTIRRRDFCALPEEIALRLLQAAFEHLGNGGDYPPRMQKQEALLGRLREEENFKGATLGGCYFALDRGDKLQIGPEPEHRG